MDNISAMIFAAGLGTRLYPLTADKPKALVQYQGKTLLEHAIQKLISSDIHHIVINVHHFADQIFDFVQSHSFDAHIEISDETELLLDTAGGFRKAAPFFKNSEHVLLYNVDIISNINLSNLYSEHLNQKHLATLAVKERDTTRHFILDQDSLQLCGWNNSKTGDTIWSHQTQKPKLVGFSGIHIVNTEILNFIPENQKLSFTPLYLELTKKYPIYGYLHNQDDWKDMGKWEDFQTQ
ncbi:MAG: Nucleotidyl transferase [Bacteroidetes bacterium]|nr:Nucleotidyl transferase [Bacteroidota bacterium]